VWNGLSASKLDALIGLESAKRALKTLFSSGGSHAVLLYGGEGSGKTTLARILAQAMLCMAEGEERPCGLCAACTAFERDVCPDFLLVEPRPPSNIIKINQVHPVKPDPNPPSHVPIQPFLRTGPISARCKVVLVEDADRMNEYAANAMLKTLEEPNDYARLILTTQAVGRLPSTILSRCIAVACECPPASELAKHVPGLSEDEAQVADGSVGEATRLKLGGPLFGKFLAFTLDLESLRTGQALKAADEFRDLCSELAEAEQCGARQAQAEALKLLARCIMKMNPQRPNWVQAVIETHRRIVGNAGAPSAFDALFAGILTDR
jgi:DNA polymerase-3 subunit delta'